MRILWQYDNGGTGRLYGLRTQTGKICDCRSRKEKIQSGGGSSRFVLGGLGVHNFYLGFAGRGIVQLLLCWTGISSIWALVDMIVIIASKNKKDAKGRLLV